MNVTVAAVSTPNAAGGIGIIRISGDCAIEIAQKVFHAASGKPLCSMRGYTAAFGRVHDAHGDIDEAVCTVFRAPKSYTGEDVAELSCHGGLYIVQRVLRAVLSAGAQPAPAGEFTKRAFMNGRLSLNEAEAVMGMISAQGDLAAKAALTALDGALSREIDEICQSLVSSAAQLAAWVDYPDDEIEELEPQALTEVLLRAKNSLCALLDRFDSGKAVTQGVETVIVGRPNTGKSTLMNLLSGCERSIVTDVAGTTRDIVEQTVRVGNVVLRLSDTAGIRDTDDTIESIGVGLAVKRLERAQLALVVLDGTDELSDEDVLLLSRCNTSKTIAVINKNDLDCVVDESRLDGLCDAVVYISAKTGSGRESLENTVCTVLGTPGFDPSVAMLTTERQRQCVERAVECTGEALLAVAEGMTLDAVTVSIDGAISALLELSGKTASQAVVDEVFSRFCVGK